MYSIYKKQSEYSKKYNLVAENVNEARAKDKLAELLKRRYERFKK